MAKRKRSASPRHNEKAVKVPSGEKKSQSRDPARSAEPERVGDGPHAKKKAEPGDGLDRPVSIKKEVETLSEMLEERKKDRDRETDARRKGDIATEIEILEKWLREKKSKEAEIQKPDGKQEAPQVGHQERKRKKLEKEHEEKDRSRGKKRKGANRDRPKDAAMTGAPDEIEAAAPAATASVKRDKPAVELGLADEGSGLRSLQAEIANLEEMIVDKEKDKRNQTDLVKKDDIDKEIQTLRTWIKDKQSAAAKLRLPSEIAKDCAGKMESVISDLRETLQEKEKKQKDIEKQRDLQEMEVEKQQKIEKQQEKQQQNAHEDQREKGQDRQRNLEKSKTRQSEMEGEKAPKVDLEVPEAELEEEGAADRLDNLEERHDSGSGREDEAAATVRIPAVGKRQKPPCDLPLWCVIPNADDIVQEVDLVRRTVDGSVVKRLLLGRRSWILLGRRLAPAQQAQLQADSQLASTEPDVGLASPLASRAHALLLRNWKGQIFLMDLGSSHGTVVDKKKLPAKVPCEWKPGAVAYFADSKVEVFELSPSK